MLQYGTKIRLWIFPELLIFSPHTLWSAWLFYTCKQKGKQMDEQFMRKKAVLPLITSMALPMVLSMLVNALYNIVDSYFVARISENAMTALSLVYPLQNLVNAIAIGFGVGISAVIALYLGAGKQKRADQAATQGMLWALVHGVLLTGVCIAIIPLFLQAFTKDQAVIDLGVRYGRIVFGFSIIINADLAFEKIFQAVGRMKVTMVGLGLGCLANIILDPLLIFGLGPFPKMGIDGAALATGLGQVLTLVIYLLFYYLRPISVKIRLQHLRPAPGGSLVCHRYSGGTEFGFAFGVDLCTERHLGHILSNLCADFRRILQTANVSVPAGQRHCAGHAPGDWVQLRRQGIWAGQADLPHRISDDCCHYGGGHRAVPGDPRSIDRSFYRECSYCCCR